MKAALIQVFGGQHKVFIDLPWILLPDIPLLLH